MANIDKKLPVTIRVTGNILNVQVSNSGASAKKTGKVVTVEEHSVIGGLGSAVCDALCELAPAPVKKIGMQDVFGESGSAAALIQKYGLDAEGVYKGVKEFL